ncbi:hypothetical protein E2C01_089968 [Portunus trituberculatus]|uniref:Uncharacterized protein n=1 Tax=Portunus trituberculatus TaxID=210409 RepID=A0A5B7JK68_PORTR|nr:hypothetical protein [Portunus trituberculatus]
MEREMLQLRVRYLLTSASVQHLLASDKYGRQTPPIIQLINPRASSVYGTKVNQNLDRHTRPVRRDLDE